MNPTDLLCNGILFLIFMLFAVLAIKHSPGGIVGLIIWAVVIIIVIGFIVYLTFGMLDMTLLGLVAKRRRRPKGTKPLSSFAQKTINMFKKKR